MASCSDNLVKGILILILIPFLAHAAEDGKANYQMFCGACHGNDGVGAKNNPNPPLAKSEWLLGSPDRAISAVLVGLTGPIEVRGRAYNLAMPPQGAVLSDEKLASILTYVRRSWGNKQKAVKPERVAKVRAALKGREKYFTAEELRKTYPIPFPKRWPRLKNLISSVYHGKWEYMPDFSDMTPHATEEEPRGLVDVAHAERQKEFAIVWEGEIHTNREGDYQALLDASDGARLFVNGQLIVEVKGVGPRGSERARRTRFRMLKGLNQFRLEYFNNQGTPGLTVYFQGPTGSAYLSESHLEVKESAPRIPLVPEKGRAILYRNFIEGAHPRAIGVGYDGGVNQAFSIGHLGMDLIWQGSFIDGGKHWSNRGKGFQKPSGTDVIRLLNQPAYAVLPDAASPWPDRGKTGLNENYLGYSLDENGLPTFRYELQGVKIREHSSFSKKEGKRCLIRKLTFTGETPPHLYLALATKPKISQGVEGEFLLDDKVSLTVEGASAEIRNGNLIAPVTSSSLIITYTWP